MRVQGLFFRVTGVGCRAHSAGFEECTDDEVTVDDLMQVGSRLMPLAVKKHPACRAPQFYVDNYRISRKRNEKKRDGTTF